VGPMGSLLSEMCASASGPNRFCVPTSTATSARTSARRSGGQARTAGQPPLRHEACLCRRSRGPLDVRATVSQLVTTRFTLLVSGAPWAAAHAGERPLPCGEIEPDPAGEPQLSR